MQIRHVAGYLKDNMTKVKEAHMQAFPFIEPEKDDNIKAYHSGMTLNDYFATKAMQADMSTYSEDLIYESSEWFEARAEKWYQVAKAMMKARK
jgi:hypothetical protein